MGSRIRSPDGMENIIPIGIRSPDRPARRESRSRRTRLTDDVTERVSSVTGTLSSCDCQRVRARQRQGEVLRAALRAGARRACTVPEFN